MEQISAEQKANHQ